MKIYKFLNYISSMQDVIYLQLDILPVIHCDNIVIARRQTSYTCQCI